MTATIVEGMNRRTLLIGASALAASGVPAPAVLSQDRYPSRPIKLVIPFPPGGPTDMLGRYYGEKLSAVLGHSDIPAAVR